MTTMPKALGPTFDDELVAAGLDDTPLSWGQTVDEIYNRDSLTEAQNVTLDGVIEAHDPTAMPPPKPPPEDVVLYDHENRLRAIEGVPPLSLGDFVQKKAQARKS
jgi:hypothetical protein